MGYVWAIFWAFRLFVRLLIRIHPLQMQPPKISRVSLDTVAWPATDSSWSA